MGQLDLNGLLGRQHGDRVGTREGGCLGGCHLGLEIPPTEDCWIKVDRQKYFWKEGKTFIFDDTYLHDAENGSDQIRVVLWLDVVKKLPFYLQIINRFLLWLAHRDESVKSIQRNALIKDDAEAA